MYRQCTSAIISVVCRMDFRFLFQILYICIYIYFSEVPEVKQVVSALHFLLPANQSALFLYESCMAIV